MAVLIRRDDGFEAEVANIGKDEAQEYCEAMVLL
jgi:hypothetical protein